jgi:glycerol-3-phosphate dehydrogenase (NAD(P)+)
MMMNKISIIGAGSFGLAMYDSLKKNESNHICVFSRQQGDVLKHNRLCNIYNYSCFNDLDYKKIAECDFIFLCMNSSNVGEFFAYIVENGLFDLLRNINFVNCAKGVMDFEKYGSLFLSDYFLKNGCNFKLCVLSGAGFADGIEMNVKTAKTIACCDFDIFTKIVSLFENSNILFDHSSNLNGVVLLGCLKNIIAIYVGYSMRSGVHINEVVYNILLIISDIESIGKFFGVSTKDCFNSSSGVGDILLTCLSGKSRNRTFGEKLAIDFDEAKNFATKNCIEGLVNLRILAKFALYNNIHTSFLTQLYDIAD